MPGAVRLSVGLGTTVEDIAQLIDALITIVNLGSGWRYRSSADSTDCWPDPDPRPRPALPVDLMKRIDESGRCGRIVV